jgi:adenylate cyclase
MFGVILGVTVAIVYTNIDFLFDKFLSKAMHLSFIILFKSFIYLLFLIFFLTFIAYLAEDYINVDFPNERGWWISNRIIWVGYGLFYYILIDICFYQIGE